MRRVIRPAVGTGMAVVALLSVLGGGAAPGATPEGPRLAFVKLGPGAYSSSLMTTDPAGQTGLALVRGFRRTRPLPFPEPPTWSPDGSTIAFAGVTGHLYDEGSKIFVVDADGGHPRPIVGTEGGGGPVFSRNGTAIAFTRRRERSRVLRPRPGEFREYFEHAVSVWLVETENGSVRQLTPWRFGVEHFPTSFSPDGTAVLTTRVLNWGPPAVVAIRLDGSGSDLLLRNASSAEFSPDGSQIAYLRHGRKYSERNDGGGVATARITDVFVRSADGNRTNRLTQTPRDEESGVTWDPSGERLAFAQLGTVASFMNPGSNAIVQMNADGTCRRKVLSLRKALLIGPVWRPGPGREAGRIAC